MKPNLTLVPMRVSVYVYPKRVMKTFGLKPTANFDAIITELTKLCEGYWGKGILVPLQEGGDLALCREFNWMQEEQKNA